MEGISNVTSSSSSSQSSPQSNDLLAKANRCLKFKSKSEQFVSELRLDHYFNHNGDLLLEADDIDGKYRELKDNLSTFWQFSDELRTLKDAFLHFHMTAINAKENLQIDQLAVAGRVLVALDRRNIGCQAKLGEGYRLLYRLEKYLPPACDIQHVQQNRPQDMQLKAIKT